MNIRQQKISVGALSAHSDFTDNTSLKKKRCGGKIAHSSILAILSTTEFYLGWILFTLYSFGLGKYTRNIFY